MSPVAQRKPRRIDKLVDALSATSLIAYFGSMDLTPSTKALLLLLAPWLALVGNAIIAVIGIYAKGFAELYSTTPVYAWIKKSAEVVLLDANASAADKDIARKLVEDTRARELHVYKEMSRKLGEFFGRS